jgi:hypothetical protein
MWDKLEAEGHVQKLLESSRSEAINSGLDYATNFGIRKVNIWEIESEIGPVV